MKVEMRRGRFVGVGGALQLLGSTFYPRSWPTRNWVEAPLPVIFMSFSSLCRFSISLFLSHVSYNSSMKLTAKLITINKKEDKYSALMQSKGNKYIYRLLNLHYTFYNILAIIFSDYYYAHIIHFYNFPNFLLWVNIRIKNIRIEQYFIEDKWTVKIQTN